MDFTYTDYRHLVRDLKASGYASRHIDGNDYNGKSLYLRHDVDIDVLGVLPLAEIEHEEGLVSTWYFLPDSPVYNLFSEECTEIIARLNELGHMVGLHVDGKRFPSERQIKAALEGTLANAKVYGISGLSRTFSFHRPASCLLEQSINLGGGWTNAYDERYYGLSECIVYVSDSNRREFWKEDRLDMAIKGGLNLTILTHPAWWHNSALASDETFDYLCESAGRRHVANHFACTAKRYADRAEGEISRC